MDADDMINDLSPVEQARLCGAVQAVVRHNAGFDTVLDDTMTGRERQRLAVAIGHALGNLEPENCERYGLTADEIRSWIAAGRPAGFSPGAPEPDFSEDPGAVIAIPKQQSDEPG
jgi:hypothetical protein